MSRLDVYVEFKRFLSIKLGRQEVRIGRAADCDIQLLSENVSRHHTTITRGSDGRFVIEDLSTNGTRVNSEMVHGRKVLAPGDRIYVDTYALVFQADDAPSEAREIEQTGVVDAAALM